MATKKHLTRVQARAIEILQGARDALKKHGWVQRSLGSKELGFCAWGAIDYSAKRAHVAGLIARRAMDTVAKRRGFSGTPQFNDSPLRTRGDVLRALRSAEKEVPHVLV